MTNLSLRECLIDFIAYLEFLPAALLCLFPMKNQLRFSAGRTVLHVLLLFLVVLPVGVYLDIRYALSYNTLTLPMLLIMFICYHWSLRVHISKSLAIFFFAIAIYSFVSNVGTGIDAILNPTSTPKNFSLEASLIKLGISFLVMLLFYYPLTRFGSLLIDQYHSVRIWFITLPVTFSFTLINLFFVPEYYETYYVHNVARAYWGIHAVLAVMLCFFCIFFYFIVQGILEQQRVEERTRILELEETQFKLQQKYMEESSRARHDFRQMIRTMDMLAKENNTDELTKLLGQYSESLPENTVKKYCKNSALNALLNYYSAEADEGDIGIDFRVAMPDNASIGDTDLCGIVGNILDNAVTACASVPREKRRISLSIACLFEKELYIAATNSFDGKVSMKDGTYLSTKQDETYPSTKSDGVYLPAKKGVHGIGLRSIQTTAEHYGGRATFHHDVENFYSDIMLPLK